jgi:hypothetical protein
MSDSFTHSEQTFSFFGKTSALPQRQTVSFTVDRHLAYLENSVLAHKVRCFFHGEQTSSFLGPTSTGAQNQTVSLTVDRHSASMKKPVQTYKVKQFLSQWTDI